MRAHASQAWATNAWSSNSWLGTVFATTDAGAGRKKGRAVSYRHMTWDNRQITITPKQERELVRRLQEVIQAEDLQAQAALDALALQNSLMNDGINRFSDAYRSDRLQYAQDQARLAQARKAQEAQELQVITQAIQSILSEENDAISYIADTIIRST